MSDVWFKGPTGFFAPKNLLDCRTPMTADRSGVIDIDVLAPGLVPQEATSIFVTHECGFLAAPPNNFGLVSLRIMPHGYSLSYILDIAKNQQVFPGGGIDVVAPHTRLPIEPGMRTFFYALQSSCPLVANKMVILDLWGYSV